MNNKMTRFQFINEYCEDVKRIRATETHAQRWMVDTGCVGGQFTAHHLEDAIGHAAYFLEIEIIGD